MAITSGSWNATGPVSGATGAAKRVRTKLEAASGTSTDWINTAPFGSFMECLIAGIMEEITTNAEVAFTAGEITGTDSNSDTHSSLVASGGSVT